MSKSDDDLSRESTPAEEAAAKEIAYLMIDALPPGTSMGIMVAAAGLMVEAIFTVSIKAEYRLLAFDQAFAAWRKNIETKMRTGSEIDG